MLKRLQFIILAVAVSLPAWAEETLTLNLNNADIRVLINTVSEMTGKNFIVDPRVKGKVTVISASPSDRKHIYDIFLSVLKVHGFAVVPSGDVDKIVPMTVAKQDNIRTLQARERNTDETATRVVEVKHVMASQLVPILRPLMPQQAHLGVHANSNTLIISDSVANMNRIIGIIRRIDQPSDQEIEIIKLEYANATELVQVLSALRGSAAKGGQGKPPGQQPALVADPRTNSILLGGDPDLRLELRALIAHLDTPVQREGNIEVFYLRYAQAKDLKAVLEGVGTKQIEAGAEAKQQKQQKPPFDIQADEATNALVVTAPPAIMQTLRSVINQLDIRRAQVYIEAIIAELSDDKAANLGIQWQSSQPSSGEAMSFIKSTDDFQFGLPGFSLGYYRGGSLRALISALITDDDTNILSTPSLLTLDNEEASIIVGENVPFVTGNYTTQTGNTSTNPFQTIERHDVGIKLTVVPQINEGDTIKLKIQQEVSSVQPKQGGAADISTKKRNIETTILVDDRQTIVLGGLIEERLQGSVHKVPLLGDIPLLGNLFRVTSNTSVKKNLMVFLRPEIVRDRRTSMQLTNSKYRYIRGVQEGIRKGSKESTFRLLPDNETPLLPALEPQTPPPGQAE